MCCTPDSCHDTRRPAEDVNDATSGQITFCRLVSYLNLGSCVVTTPTSSSEGLKSMERTVDRQEIAVCWGRSMLVDKFPNLKNMLIKIRSRQNCFCFCSAPSISLFVCFVPQRFAQRSNPVSFSLSSPGSLWLLSASLRRLLP